MTTARVELTPEEAQAILRRAVEESKAMTYEQWARFVEKVPGGETRIKEMLGEIPRYVSAMQALGYVITKPEGK